MIHHNDKILKDMNINSFKEFGTDGLIEVISKLEDRISALEAKYEPKKRGRPPKVVNG